MAEMFTSGGINYAAGFLCETRLHFVHPGRTVK